MQTEQFQSKAIYETRLYHFKNQFLLFEMTTIPKKGTTVLTPIIAALDW